MMLASPSLAAMSVGPKVFPEPLCENLLEVTPKVKAGSPASQQNSLKSASVNCPKTALEVFAPVCRPRAQRAAIRVPRPRCGLRAKTASWTTGDLSIWRANES